MDDSEPESVKDTELLLSPWKLPPPELLLWCEPEWDDNDRPPPGRDDGNASHSWCCLPPCPPCSMLRLPPLLPCVELSEDPEEWCERFPDEWYPPPPRAKELSPDPASLLSPDPPTPPPPRRRLDGLLAYSCLYGLSESLSAPLPTPPPPPLWLWLWW